jgi:NAD(P)-dependent dehydrogenase (short-subunit alcohol dehydrogenase family)
MATVLITGCDTGLGVEFARQYAAAGWRVFATCLDPERAEATRAVAGEVILRKLDVTDHAAIEALARELRDESIDVLLGNAGIGRPHPGFGETDYPHWRLVLETNLIAPMRLAESSSSRWRGAR